MKKPYLTADAGLNTNGKPNRAYDLISHAKQCGFDAIKFQLYDAERLVEGGRTRELLEAGKFCQDWLPWIREQCDLLKIDLAVTPFYPEAVDIIKPYVDFIKIGSYEMFYSDLLSAVVESELPIVASAGLVKYPQKLWIRNLDTLLYCVSKYPCGIDDIDMSWIAWAKENVRANKIGYSDHSHDPNAIWAALIAGAEHIELHFDIEGCGLEYPVGHVWTSAECFDLISNIKSAIRCFEPSDFVPDYSKRTDQNGRRR